MIQKLGSRAKTTTVPRANRPRGAPSGSKVDVDRLLDRGRVSEAIDWLQDLVRDYPDWDWAWLALG